MDVVSDQVSYVNAPVLAEQRGVATRLVTTPDSPEYRNLLTVKGASTEGTQLSVAGTLTGPKQIEKLVGINGYEIEIPITDHMIVLRYADRPGVIGTLGNVLGEQGVNIAGMQVARKEERGEAVAVLAIDSALPAGVLDIVRAAIGATVAREINLED